MLELLCIYPTITFLPFLVVFLSYDSGVCERERESERDMDSIIDLKRRVIKMDSIIDPKKREREMDSFIDLKQSWALQRRKRSFSAPCLSWITPELLYLE